MARNSTSLSDELTERAAFGLRLRGLREARGISLERVAACTKINVVQLAALERGDLSRWPTGIFARGFVRAYADCIGEEGLPLVAEFRRLFPEVGALADDAQGRRLRMTLVEESALVRAAAWLGRLTTRRTEPIPPDRPASEPLRII